MVALVTGGARGMGRSHVVRLAKEGADVVVNDICHDLPGVPYPLATAEQLQKTVSDAKAVGVRSIGFKADVSKEPQVKRMIEGVIKKFGHLDILVNNAGVGSWGPVVQLTTQEWDATYNVDLKGSFLCCKYAAPHMMKKRFGKIINVTGAYGVQGGPLVAHYGAIKAGVIALTQTLALELAPFNINANAVCPALVYTEAYQFLLKKMYPDQDPRAAYERVCKDGLLFQREITVDDVSNAVVWLASEETRNMSGEIIFITAGAEKTIAKLKGSTDII